MENDSISRVEVLSLFDNYIDGSFVWAVLRMKIAKMPPVQALSEVNLKLLNAAEPKWIPCTDKLPEYGVIVLVSHVGSVWEDYLGVEDGALYFRNSGIGLDEERNNLAWMPMPEAWKGY